MNPLSIPNASCERLGRTAGWATLPVRTLLWALFFAAPLMAASSQKLSDSLKAADPSSTVNVIIHFKQTPTDDEHQKIQSLGGTRKPAQPASDSEGNAKKTSEAYIVPAGALDEIAEDANVVSIVKDVTATHTRDAVYSGAGHAPAVDPQTKISQDLKSLASDASVNVIVQYTDGPTDANGTIPERGMDSDASAAPLL